VNKYEDIVNLQGHIVSSRAQLVIVLRIVTRRYWSRVMFTIFIDNGYMIRQITISDVFFFEAPTVWNSIPSQVRLTGSLPNFKRHLK